MNIWRERLSRWFTPLARRCPLSPNAISVIALLISLGGAALLAYRYFVAAIVLIALAGLADAFDGIVARVQSKETRYGDFLDHVSDRIADTTIAACWMIGNDVRQPILVTAVILVMLTGYMGTQIEATWGQRSYESVGRGEFVLALIVFPIVSSILWRHGWASIRIYDLTIAEAMSLLLVAFALLGVGQRLALARRLG
jgi:phosphatidylglycerophosphate synthase